MDATRQSLCCIASAILLSVLLVWATCDGAEPPAPSANPKCFCPSCACGPDCKCADGACACEGCQVKAEPVRLVLFTAEWCLPCQKMHPSWRKVSAENPGLLAEYDFDLNEEWARSLGVRVLPQVLVMRGEKVVERASIGAKSETQIRMLVEKWRGE